VLTATNDLKALGQQLYDADRATVLELIKAGRARRGLRDASSVEGVGDASFRPLAVSLAGALSIEATLPMGVDASILGS
jgi:hypothetical protein